MATGTTKVAPTNANVLNAVRGRMSLTYQDRIPEATQENLGDIYSAIMKYQVLRNELVSALVKVIGLQTIDAMMFKNPLAYLKKDPMRFGNTHEEIFVNMIKGTPFDCRAGVERAFRIYESNIMAMYHNINFEMQYPVTISFNNLRNAFQSSYGIRDLISAKVMQCFSSANYDEYLVMKRLAEAGYTRGYLYPVTVQDVTDKESADTMLALVKEYVGNMGFPNPAYNYAGATSFSAPNTLVFITTPALNAQLGVRSEAYMFNADRAAISVETVLVDKFENPAIKAVLCDARFFNVREQFREFTDNYNGAALNWNYFYTVVQLMSASPFYPCVVFTTDGVSISGITANDFTYTPNEEMNIMYQVTGTQNAYIPQEVDFELSGNTDVNTCIVPGTNTLVVGANEEGSLSVKVTSRYNGITTATATGTKKV